jgi:ATP-dependent DNA helicase DinG
MTNYSEAQKRMAEYVQDFFGPGGEMVSKFGGKDRVAQREMAGAIGQKFYEEKSLLVEAPTGTGKTLAYLGPIAFYRRDNPDQRFIISVSTKHLQSQIEEDIHRFGEVLPELKSFAVLKGASNYLCLSRLKHSGQSTKHSPQTKQELENLKKMINELDNLPHGWREELPIKITDQTWAAISGESSCCKTGLGCYRKLAKKLATDAKVVIVNSDLLGYNMKYQGKPIPGRPEDKTPILVMDEAHTLLGRLTEVESADLSFRSLENALNNLTRDAIDDNAMKVRVMTIIADLEDIRKAIINGSTGPVQPNPADASESSQIVVQPKDANGQICHRLIKTIEDIKRMAITQKMNAQTADTKQDYQEIESRLQFASETLDKYLSGKMSNYVLLLKRATNARGETAINIELKPFELTEPLGKLWGAVKSVTLVSATLIGVSIPETKKAFNAEPWDFNNYLSPFNYPGQMRVFLPPKTHTVTKPVEIAEQIKRIAKITDGRLLGLFTNYAIIKEVTQLLTPWCKENDIKIFAQERNQSPDVLCNLYRNNPKSIVLGNQSMGTGVDMRIRALVITKLPFEQQSPYKDARALFLKSKGINPFKEDTLPDTIRRWKQWVGRLIRTESQKGLLVILDDKINTKSYAPTFLKALPAKIRMTHLDDPAYPLPTPDQFQGWVNPPKPAPPTIS